MNVEMTMIDRPAGNRYYPGPTFHNGWTLMGVGCYADDTGAFQIIWNENGGFFELFDGNQIAYAGGLRECQAHAKLLLDS